jgi:hypothetical protein
MNKPERQEVGEGPKGSRAEGDSPAGTTTSWPTFSGSGANEHSRDGARPLVLSPSTVPRRGILGQACKLSRLTIGDR